MVLDAVNTVIAGTGIVLAVAIAVHHSYQVISGYRGGLHTSLEGYYKGIIPYIVASSIVAAGFFTEAFLPREALVNVFRPFYLVDVAFLGLILIWMGAAYRVFSTMDDLAETYFSGDGDAV